MPTVLPAAQSTLQADQPTPTALAAKPTTTAMVLAALPMWVVTLALTAPAAVEPMMIATVSRATQDTGYGSGTAAGAGYGNKTGGYKEQELGDFQASEGLGDSPKTYTGGHHTYGSSATGGAGFGNKSSSYEDNNGEYRGSEGMGITANRTLVAMILMALEALVVLATAARVRSSSFGDDDSRSKKVSTAGKLMEKVGGLFENEDMERKGAEKRARAGRDEDDPN
ncbi:hypothetical protein GJ744_009928 [Endocarpon pusillum]|uniref:Uncharacterized protein n=1 Tax=Endocarpon pusillum TaxID=364733 RepID=A0A8H7E297_9EURO|nr:hypothetical protein GJ744_009928 [Endocarpon pusillum]